MSPFLPPLFSVPVKDSRYIRGVVIVFFLNYVFLFLFSLINKIAHSRGTVLCFFFGLATGYYPLKRINIEIKLDYLYPKVGT